MRIAALMVTLLTTAGLVGCQGTASPSSDDEKTVYSIAYETGKKLQMFQLTDGEMKVFRKGLNDGVKDAKEEVDVKQQLVKVSDLIQKRSAVIAEKETKEATTFLDGLAKEAGAQKTESGLIFKELSPGTGATPAATDKVKVHYHGTLRDGKVFDSSRERGQPATFPLNGVIPCWTEGVQKMKVGGKAILGCPAAIAYKERGAPPVIKPGAALKFEVELIEIVKDDTPAPGAPPTKKK